MLLHRINHLLNRFLPFRGNSFSSPHSKRVENKVEEIPQSTFSIRCTLRREYPFTSLGLLNTATSSSHYRPPAISCPSDGSWGVDATLCAELLSAGDRMFGMACKKGSPVPDTPPPKTGFSL
jgi:hypothetical protein